MGKLYKSALLWRQARPSQAKPSESHGRQAWFLPDFVLLVDGWTTARIRLPNEERLGHASGTGVTGFFRR